MTDQAEIGRRASVYPEETAGVYKKRAPPFSKGVPWDEENMHKAYQTGKEATDDLAQVHRKN